MTKIDLIQRRHLHGSPTVHCFRFIVILVAVALALILSVFPLETVTTAGLGVATLLAFRSFQLASSWLWPGLEARAIAGHPEASNRPDRPDGPPLSLPSAPSVLFIEVDTPSGPARCAVCADPIADDAVACPDCGVPYHRECHEYLGGCAIYGCIPSLDPPGACRSPGPTGSGPELWRRDEGADGPEAPGRGLVMNGLFMLAGGSFAILGVFDPALVAFQAMTALVLSTVPGVLATGTSWEATHRRNRVIVGLAGSGLLLALLPAAWAAVTFGEIAVGVAVAVHGRRCRIPVCQDPAPGARSRACDQASAWLQSHQGGGGD